MRPWSGCACSTRTIAKTRIPLHRDGVRHHALIRASWRARATGLRADGPYDPPAGLWFDPAKLLLDPYAVQIDRPFAYHPDLAAPRDAAIDTAALMPKAVVVPPAPPPRRPALPVAGGLIYEVNVRGFTDAPTRRAARAARHGRRTGPIRRSSRI